MTTLADLTAEMKEQYRAYLVDTLNARFPFVHIESEYRWKEEQIADNLSWLSRWLFKTFHFKWITSRFTFKERPIPNGHILELYKGKKLVASKGFTYQTITFERYEYKE